MATLCRNCGAPVLFDPKSQKVICGSCNGAFDPADVKVTVEGTKLREVGKVLSEYIDDEVTEHYLNCSVYCCQSCGGEIIVNGTEGTGRCIYCGSSSVVFSRISREKAPELIIPFSITRQEALQKIKQAFKRHFFIPKEIRDFKPDQVRGIYVPYWLVSGRHVEADVIQCKVGYGDNTKTLSCGRAGSIKLKNLPVDGSRILSDQSSQSLEPFDLTKIKEFHESYLLGFYSNVSDVRYKDLQQAAEVRASLAFQDQVMESIPGHEVKILDSAKDTIINQKELYYAMFPVWFVTYNYQGKHNTIMVNGQTGKVVSGTPWDEKIVTRITFLIGSLFTIAGTIIGSSLFSLLRETKENDPRVYAFYILLPILLGVVAAAYGSSRMSRVKHRLKLSQEASIYNFVSKRQGDD